MDDQTLYIPSINTASICSFMDKLNYSIIALHNALCRRALFDIARDPNFLQAFTYIMSRRELRHMLKEQGLKKYIITEKLFPRKKKRGTMRRNRKHNKDFAELIGTLPGDVYIDEWDWREES